MMFRARFSLRVLFVVVTLCAVTVATFLAWRKSTLNWIQARHEVFQSPYGGYGIFVMTNDSGRTKPPWTLQLCGERYGYNLIQMYSDWGAGSDAAVKVRQLFPEATVVAKTHDEWTASVHMPIVRPSSSK